MVSPEPGFWIHAVSKFKFFFSCWKWERLLIRFFFQCVDLAKTPRPLPPANKGKSKDKGKSGAKAIDKGESSVVYDYHDASVHDLALRAQVLRGYEEFKVCDGIALRACAGAYDHL